MFIKNHLYLDLQSFMMRLWEFKIIPEMSHSHKLGWKFGETLSHFTLKTILQRISRVKLPHKTSNWQQIKFTYHRGHACCHWPTNIEIKMINGNNELQTHKQAFLTKQNTSRSFQLPRSIYCITSPQKNKMFLNCKNCKKKQIIRALVT